MNELLAEFLCGYTATNGWLAILPEMLLALLALFIARGGDGFPQSSTHQIGQSGFLRATLHNGYLPAGMFQCFW